MLVYFESLTTVLLDAELLTEDRSEIDWARVHVISDCIIGLERENNE